MKSSIRKSTFAGHRDSWYRLLAFVVLLIFALIAGACGVSDEAPTPTTEVTEPTMAPTTEVTEPTETAVTPDPLEALEAAAKEEGIVVLYTTSDPTAAEETGRQFTEKYGIDVEILRLTTSKLSQRFAAEQEAGSNVADVFVLANPIFMDDAINNGWLATGEDFPALDAWPTEYWNGTYALMGTNLIVIGWNSDLVSDADAPKDWPDLLDPKWKGEILFVDPRNVPAFLSWANLMKDTYGEEFLTGLAAQDLQLVASVVPGSQSIAAGEAWIIIPEATSVLVPLQAEGAPIKAVTPELTSGVENYGAVVSNAPHPNAARLLFNFLLSPEGQQAFSVDGGMVSVLGIPGAVQLPSLYQPVRIEEALQIRDELLALLGIE